MRARGFALSSGRRRGLAPQGHVTPHANGIEGWSVADVVTVLKMGTSRDMSGICPPMSAGPMGAFGGLTDEDATDIGHYLTSLPPGDNMIPGDCMAPMAP